MNASEAWKAHRLTALEHETSRPGAVTDIAGTAANEEGFLYRRGELLVNEEGAHHLRRADRGAPVEPRDRTAKLIDLGIDLQRWSLPAGDSATKAHKSLKGKIGNGLAELNHVFTGEWIYHGGPAGPPSARPGLGALPAMGSGSADLTVLDTGLFIPRHTMVNEVQNMGSSPTDYTDELDGDHDLHLDAQAGHGTFICGIIRQMNPQLVIEQRKVLSANGFGNDYDIATALATAEAPIISLSLGGYTYNNLQPVAMGTAIQHAQNSGKVVVAAAGNNGANRPFWPAAMPEVVAVAACHHDGRRAAFSNYGTWVDVCALGVDLSSCYVDGWSGAPFSGWATWSGTSFASPQVAAAIAEQMKTGLTAQQAAQEVRSRLSTPPGTNYGRWYQSVMGAALPTP
jgi:subtilisin family serine protease